MSSAASARYAWPSAADRQPHLRGHGRRAPLLAAPGRRAARRHRPRGPPRRASRRSRRGRGCHRRARSSARRPAWKPGLGARRARFRDGRAPRCTGRGGARRAAQATVRRTRTDSASSGTMFMLSSSAAWLSPELAGGGERFRTGQQQLDALVAGRSRRQETQCGGEPARGARGRTRSRRLSGLSQQLDRSLVALTRGAFDVVSDRRDAGDPRACERVGTALVRTEPPAAGHRLVHRAADERMAEAEPPRNVRLADEIQPQQLVERVDRCRRRRRRRPRPPARGRTGRRRRRRPRG